MENNQVINNMGFCEWLTLLLVGAKLFGYIDWNWLLVFCPILAELCILLIIGMVTLIFQIINK